MIFQFSDGEFSDQIATSLKMLKKSIVLVSVTLEKLNGNPQACPPSPLLPKNSITHSSLAPHSKTCCAVPAKTLRDLVGCFNH